MDDLRRLLAAASNGGRWEREYVRWAVRHISRNVDFPDHLVEYGDLPDTYQGWEYIGFPESGVPDNADANLIVAAVNALPALLDVAEAAKMLADFDPAPHDEQDAGWIFQTLLDGLRAALRRLEEGR